MVVGYEFTRLSKMQHDILFFFACLNFESTSSKDGWMICDFTSFSTVFQSYQDDGRMITKGCEQWNPVDGIEDFASSGARTRDR